MARGLHLTISSGIVLSLSTLDSDNDVDEGIAGVRCLRDGHVDEIQSGGAWVSQAAGTQYVNDNTFDVGDDFEVMLTGSGYALSGPALATWFTISSTRQWTLEPEKEEGSQTFNGTMTIREIADTGNSVSALVTITGHNRI